MQQPWRKGVRVVNDAGVARRRVAIAAQRWERTGRKERTAILRPSGGKVISFAEVVIHLREAGLVEGRRTNVGDEIVG